MLRFGLIRLSLPAMIARRRGRRNFVRAAVQTYIETVQGAAQLWREPERGKRASLGYFSFTCRARLRHALDACA